MNDNCILVRDATSNVIEKRLTLSFGSFFFEINFAGILPPDFNRQVLRLFVEARELWGYGLLIELGLSLGPFHAIAPHFSVSEQ